jgi:importin subunit alpha-6/7
VSITERRGFKQPVTHNHARQNRLTSTLEIRKTKKDQRMKARRMQGTSPREQQMLLVQQQQQQQDLHNDQPTMVQLVDLPRNKQHENSATVIQRCMGTMQQWWSPAAHEAPLPLQPTNEVQEAMKDFRRLMANGDNPPVQEILLAGALPYMAMCLAYDSHPDLQFQTAWALTNIASTCHSQQVFDEPGVVDQSVRLLMTSPGVALREQCAWLLSNMAGDGLVIRNALLANPAFRQAVAQSLQNPASLDLLKQVSWLALNLTRLRPTPRRDHVEFLVAPFAHIVSEAMTNPVLYDHDLLPDALWSLVNMSHEVDADANEGRIDAVMRVATPEILTRLVAKEMQGAKDKTILIPAIRALGNFVSGSEKQCQAVLDAKFLDHALDILKKSSSVAVKKELCWLLSNVCAGTHDQIKLIFHSQLEELLIEIAMSSRWEVRIEATWSICNICIWGSGLMRSSIVAKGALDALSRILSTTACDKTMILGVLDAFEKLLEDSQARGRNVPILLEQAGGIDKLEDLQAHPDDEVYNKSKGIIEKFFGAEDDDMDEENQDPSAFLDEAGNFAFKLPSRKLFGDDFNASFAASPSL